VLIYCLLLCGILHGVAVTDACHIFETCKFLLCSTCFHVYAFLIVSCALCITFVADFIPENWLWQCFSSGQKSSQGGKCSECDNGLLWVV